MHSSQEMNYFKISLYASYKTFNAMLSDILTKVDVSEKVTQPF